MGSIKNSLKMLKNKALLEIGRVCNCLHTHSICPLITSEQASNKFPSNLSSASSSSSSASLPNPFSSASQIAKKTKHTLFHIDSIPEFAPTPLHLNTINSISSSLQTTFTRQENELLQCITYLQTIKF